MPFAGKKLSDGSGDRVDEGYHAAQRNHRYGLYAISLILLRVVMAEGNLHLVVEPVLVVGASTGIESPLTETLAYSTQVVGNWLAVRTGEVVHQMSVRRGEAVPEIKDCVDLIAEQLAGHVQILLVFGCLQHCLLQKIPFFLANRRLCYLRCAIGVTGNRFAHNPPPV